MKSSAKYLKRLARCLCYSTAHAVRISQVMKQQWLIKIKRRNIQLLQHIRMCHVYCYDSDPGCKIMRFQLALNKTFYPTPPTLTNLRLRHHQRTKTDKMLSVSSYRLSTQIWKYQNWKTNKYSILTVIELGPPMQSPQLGSQSFMPLQFLNLNTNFIKQKSKIG